MRFKIILIAVMMFLSCSGTPASRADTQPAVMDKIVFRIIEPRLTDKENSWAALPKIMYRAGDSYVRSEEAYDPAQNIKLLLICTGNDLWMIDLISKTGRHKVNREPTPSTYHQPIFSEPAKFKNIAKLEFGRELSFFLEHGARPVDAKVLGKPAHKYELTVDNQFHVTLWTSIKNNTPLQISCTDSQHKMTWEYQSYQQHIAFERSLFEPPAGIPFTDFPAQSTSPSSQ